MLMTLAAITGLLAVLQAIFILAFFFGDAGFISVENFMYEKDLDRITETGYKIIATTFPISAIVLSCIILFGGM